MRLNPFSKKREEKKVAKRSFEAAKFSRLLANWALSSTTLDADLEMDLVTLRDRARDLSLNNPHFRRYLKTTVKNVVGPAGIRVQVRPKQRDGTIDLADGNLIEAAWSDWSKKGNCDVTRRYTWKQVQAIVLQGVKRDGEAFVHLVRRDSFKYGFKVRIIEPDLVDESYHNDLANGNRIRMGVELNGDGEPVAYYLRPDHPGDNRPKSVGSRRQRVPASDMLHIFDPERAHQTRGFPNAAAIMQRVKMLAGYEEAEVVAARLGASKLGVIYTETGEAYEGDGEDAEDPSRVLMNAEPGEFEQLPPGWKIDLFDPKHPGTNFGTFVKGILRSIATGLGMSYNTFANDLEGVNYSSLRQGALDERDEWREDQGFLIDHLLRPVFEDWLYWALSLGRIGTIPFSKFAEKNAPIFQPRGWNWIDPLKEVSAAEKSIQNRLKSRTQILAEQGQDFAEVIAQLAEEEALAKSLGVNLEEMTSSQAPGQLDPAALADD